MKEIIKLHSAYEDVHNARSRQADRLQEPVEQPRQHKEKGLDFEGFKDDNVREDPSSDGSGTDSDGPGLGVRVLAKNPKKPRVRAEDSGNLAMAEAEI